MPRNPHFRSFASSLIVSIMPFINKPTFPRDLVIFIKSFISLFEITNVVMPDPNFFSLIAASLTDTASVNPNGTKLLLANGF